MTTKTDSKPANSRGVAATLGGAQANAARVSTALNQSGRAYVTGLLALGRALGDLGRETLAETGRHVKATVDARSLHQVAELQAAWAQNRVETITAQAKELADLARGRSEEVIAPLNALLQQQDRAA